MHIATEIDVENGDLFASETALKSLNVNSNVNFFLIQANSGFLKIM